MKSNVPAGRRVVLPPRHHSRISSSGLAGEHPLAQVSVLDVEEREAMAVEFAAQVVTIGLGKIAACMQADLIEHARKIDKAADDIVRTAR